MQNLNSYLSIEPETINKKKLLLYIVVAFIFSIGIRYLLYIQYEDDSTLFGKNILIPLWNPDSGLYGYYAKSLLAGKEYPFVAEYMPGYLLYWFTKITGVSLNKLLFFLPSVLASLSVIPIILIANIHKITQIGFFAALLGTTAIGYYARSHLGYYDTDVLNIFFPMLAIYFLMKLVELQSLKYAFYSSITLILFTMWYHNATILVLNILGVFMLYTFIFERKSKIMYQSLFVLVSALLPVVFLYKIVIATLLYVIFIFINKKYKFDYKYFMIAVFVGFLGISFLLGSSNFYKRANDYINKKQNIDLQIKDTKTVHFKSSLATVQEAQKTDFTTLAQRIFGIPVYTIFALAGYLLLLYLYRSMFLSISMVFITLISPFAGLRFTMYGVMFLAMGLVYIIYASKNIFTKWAGFSAKTSDYIIKALITVIVFVSISFIYRFNHYKKPMLFSSIEDINALHKLETTTQNDYIITWWDYGWPLWYYTNLNTIIDNGKHHEDNYIVSKILLSNNSNFVKNATLFFTNDYDQARAKGYPSVMRYFLQQNNLSYLDQMKSDSFHLSNISKRVVYIMLHKRMLKTLQLIESFSNIDIQTGKTLSSEIVRLSTANSIIDNNQGFVSQPAGKFSIGSLDVFQNNKLIFQKKYNNNINIHAVVIDNQILILKQNIYDSLLIQTLLFDKYDKEKFEKVAQTSNFVVLKVKP